LLAPFFKKTCHTPNTLTTYSLLTGLIACYGLFIGRLEIFIIFFIISFFFDCFDGYFARRYGMTSKGGDTYDHVKDLAIAIVILVVVFWKYRQVVTLPILLVMALLFALCSVHNGCQQKYFNEQKGGDQNDQAMDMFQCMCRDTADLKYTRFFGPGMFMVFTIIAISYVWAKKYKLI
jgi:phosphatidylserine synthase